MTDPNVIEAVRELAHAVAWIVPTDDAYAKARRCLDRALTLLAAEKPAAPATPAPVATPDERSQAQIDKARTALAAERARADEAERLLAEARGEIAGLDRAAEAQVEALKAERAKSAAQVAAARAVRAVIEKHGHIDHHGHREPGRRTCGDDCAALDLIDTALAAGEA